MKQYLPVFILFACCIAISACNEQQKVDAPGQEQKQVQEATPIEKKASDIDPYFIEGETINTAYGPTNITRNILQDRKGNMWFASWQGIIRYDGEQFTNFTNKEGLKRARTFSLLEDSKGHLWFGTIGAGIYRYDGASFQHFTIEDGLVSNAVTCITEDSKGNMWFGTLEGISRYDGTTFHNLTTKDGLTDNDVNAIVEDENGMFWFATRGTTCFYDGTEFTTFKKKDDSSFGNVRTIIKDSKGNIWLGGKDGLWCYDGKLLINLTTDFIGNLFEDKKGNIWVSRSEANNIYQMSLCRYEEASIPSMQAVPTRILKAKGQVFGILEDTKGHIWFGLEQGVGRYDGRYFEYFKAAADKEWNPYKK